jgi:hypothetical protein
LIHSDFVVNQRAELKVPAAWKPWTGLGPGLRRGDETFLGGETFFRGGETFLRWRNFFELTKVFEGGESF